MRPEAKTPTRPGPEARLQRALQRLGTARPVCCHCGESDPRCLEKHHLAGQAFADELVIECRNCHRKLSDAQLDHPPPSGPEPDTLERIGHLLLGLADFFALLIGQLREFGDYLIKMSLENSGSAEINHVT